jgi:hypothetical protein
MERSPIRPEKKVRRRKDIQNRSAPAYPDRWSIERGWPRESRLSRLIEMVRDVR